MLSYLNLFNYSKLIRLGKNNDGGYIIGDIKKYDLFISGGISNDISFENDFIKKYGIKCIAFDESIDKLPEINNKIKFIKKHITTYDNLNKYCNISKYKNIFMKMDIEGAEYLFLESFKTKDLLRIKQLVIEFHDNTKTKILDKLAKTHYLIHIHGNNYRNHIGILPEVFECTYIRKDNHKLKKSKSINHELDMPNNPDVPEILLDYKPFIDI